MVVSGTVDGVTGRWPPIEGRVVTVLVVAGSVVCEKGKVCRAWGASVLGVSTVVGVVCGVVVGAVVAGEVVGGGGMVPHLSTGQLVVGGVVVLSRAVVAAAALPAPRGEPVVTLTTKATLTAAKATCNTATAMRLSISPVSRPGRGPRTASAPATFSSHNVGSVINSPAKIRLGLRGSGSADRLVAIIWSQ